MKITKTDGIFLAGFIMIGIMLCVIVFQGITPYINNNTSTLYPPVINDPSSVIVAAGDSSVESKARADFVSDGRNDQEEIQRAIMAAGEGGKVVLLEGTFFLTDNIIPLKNQLFTGIGENITILNFTASSKRVLVREDGITCAQFQIRGKGYLEYRNNNLLFDHITIYNVDNSHWAAFHGYYPESGVTVENVTFIGCKAIDCDRSGFMNQPVNPTSYTLKNFTYLDCQAVNSGKYDHQSSWDVGFDFAEEDAILENFLIDGCLAEGSWESGFHFESSVTKINVTLRNSTSVDNCQKEKSGGQTGKYCSGFLLTRGNIVLENCISRDNKFGFFVSGTDHTLINCSDTDSDFGFYLKGTKPVTIKGGSITTSTQRPIFITGDSEGIISDMVIRSSSLRDESYGIYLDTTVSHADRILVENSTIEGSIPYMLDIGIGNYARNGLDVRVRNVSVKGANNNCIHCTVLPL